MQMLKKKNGITLVALIITIIVLLILAGVSLSFVFNGGILDKSQQAVNEYQNAANNESEILEYIDSTLEQKINEINSGYGGGSDSSGIQVGDIVTAGDIAKVEDKSEIYGAEVKGYDCENNAGVESWKLFYADNENVYLIASNYIHKDYCPDGIGETPITDNGNGYKLSMNDVINDYNGASDIKDESLQNLNSNYFSKYGSENSSNNNMKAVAYMLDTSEEVWGKFAGEKAKYAIGGPTIELLFKSYNEKYNTKNKYQAQATSATGYKISADGGNSFDTYITISGYYLNKEDDLYVINERDRAYYMWLASPSIINYDLLGVNYDGDVGFSTFYTTSTGFRPVVCLQPDVELEKQQDGSFLLK